MGHKFTQEKIDSILEDAKTMSGNEIAIKHNMAVPSVYRVCRKNKVKITKPKQKPQKLSNQQEEYIVNNIHKESVSELAKNIGSTMDMVKGFCKKNKIDLKSIFSDRKKEWERIKEYIAKWAPHIGPYVLAKELGMTGRGVAAIAIKLGIRKLSHGERLCSKCRTNFTKEEFGSLCEICHNIKYIGYRQKIFNEDPVANRLKTCLCRAKASSKKKNIPFDLDLDYLLSLWVKQKQKCPYSGELMMAYPFLAEERKFRFNSVSIDRIIPKNGYTKGNIVLCTHWANVAKSDYTVEQFITMCKAIANHNSGD